MSLPNDIQIENRYNLVYNYDNIAIIFIFTLF